MKLANKYKMHYSCLVRSDVYNRGIDNMIASLKAHWRTGRVGERASLGVINHLDRFLSTVWKMVSTVEVEPQMRTDINNMLTLSCVAVNQLGHMQVRLLAGNAAFRREEMLDASVLDRAGALFLRSQPIGAPICLAGGSWSPSCGSGG